MRGNSVWKTIWVATWIAFLTFSPTSPVQAKEKLVVMTWGGHFGESLREAFAKPFEKKFGIDVEIEIQTGTQGGLARILAQKNNPQVDVATTTEPAALVMRSQGAIYKLPLELMPNTQNLGSKKGYLAEDWVAIYDSISGIFYRADMVSMDLQNWEDLWNPRLKGLVTVPIVPFSSGRFLVTTALIHGGSERNIEPAFKAAERLKPNIAMFFKTDAESIKYVQSKEAAVCAYGLLPNVLKLLGKDSVYRFVVPPKYIMRGWTSMVLTNAKKKELAGKFINFCLSPEAQSHYCNLLGATPTVTNAKLPEKLVELKILPIDTRHIYSIDQKEVNENLKKWSERWDREIARK